MLIIHPSRDVQYIVIPVFFIMLFGWKLLKRTTFVRLDDMDFDSGKRQRECFRSSPSSLARFWFLPTFNERLTLTYILNTVDEMEEEERARYKPPTTWYEKLWACLV